MKKQGEIALLLVYTLVYKRQTTKKLKKQSSQITKSEGFAFQIISLRLSSELMQKLNETLDTMGIGTLKNGDDRSEKLRKYIQVTYETLVVNNPARVTTDKPHTRRCYMTDRTVSVKEVCEPCRIRTPKEFLDCPEVNKELGASL